MNGQIPARYQLVSRRAMLKTSLGAGTFLLIPGLACRNDDESILAGETASPPSSDPTTTTAPNPTSTTSSASPSSSSTAPETTALEVDQTVEQPSTGQALPVGVAVNGELVVSFTYTQGATGKNERPHVAVWIEDAAGELVETVALWYQQGRRGERWIDHLSRWYDVDLARQALGGVDDAATISSATHAPGLYAVAWDGSTDTTPVGAGDYFICIEAVREEGPYSLIRQPLNLSGSLAETALPDDGELSLASVRIDG